MSAPTALAELREVAGQPGIGAAVLGLDPHRWELVRFLLREGTALSAEAGRPAEADAPAMLYEASVPRRAAPALGAAP